MAPAYRTTSRLVGAGILLSTLSYASGSALVAAALSAPAPAGGGLLGGALLQLFNSALVIAIGALLGAAVRPSGALVARGYLIARVAEGALLAAGALLQLAQGAAASGSALTLFHLAMIALGLGSAPLCALLYRTRQIPRWMAALGVVGYIALLAGSALELAGVDTRLLGTIPGGLFELALPIWLLWRGLGEPRVSAAAR